MAYAYHPQGVKILPRNHRNTQSTFKPIKEECAVHQDKAKAARGSQHKHVTWPENQRRVHQGLWRQEHSFLISNRKIPHALTKRKQICHSDGVHKHQCYPSRTNEKLQGSITEQGVPRYDDTYEAGRNSTQKTRPRKQSVRSDEGNNTGRVPHGHGVGTTRVPSQECSRGGNQKLQSKFSQRVGQDGRRFSAFTVGQTTNTDRNNAQHFAPVQRNPKYFSVCTLMWDVRLK